MSRSDDGTRTGSTVTRLRELRLRMAHSGFEALGVGELIESLQTCGTVRFRSLSCRGCSGTTMIEVDEPVDVARIAALEYVDSFDLVGRGPDRYEYLLRMELPECRDVLAEHDGEFYVDGPLVLDDSGLTFTAVASQDALERIDAHWNWIEDFDAHFEILRIGVYTGRRDRTAPLTERQRDILTTAVQRDYFDVPRGVSPDELADEFDLDKSTVLEHIRRAERNLLKQTFERDVAEASLD